MKAPDSIPLSLIRHHRFFELVVFVLAALGLATTSAFAQSSYAKGLVIYKKTVTEAPHYYEGVLFREFNDVAAWFEFDTGQKNLLRLEKGMVCKIVSFELWDASHNQVTVFSMNISTDADIKQILELQRTLNEEVKKSPKLAVNVKTMDDILTNLVKQYQDGYFRIAGQWVLKSTYLANQASRATAATRTVLGSRQMGVTPLNGRLEE